MKFISLVLVFCTICSFHVLAQEQELEHFRKELTIFVNYDNSKPGSLPKSDSNTYFLKKNMEDAFLKFVYHKDSKNLDSLKKHAQTDGKRSYWYNNYSYFLTELARDFTKKSKENNVDYYIGFYGLYDYKLSNFVSVYIQPFNLDKENFVVYYYKLNGKGKYFIKNIKSNKIFFTGEAFTSNKPIRLLRNIDKNHILLLEDMGNDGQRAMVLKRSNESLKE